MRQSESFGDDALRRGVDHQASARLALAPAALHVACGGDGDVSERALAQAEAGQMTAVLADDAVDEGRTPDRLQVAAAVHTRDTVEARRRHQQASGLFRRNILNSNRTGRP